MNKIIKRQNILIIMIIVLSMIFTACNTQDTTMTNSKQKLYIHFLDVGQADSSLIQLPNGEVVLIDGGKRDDKDLVVDYIKGLNINKIDYLIATHPHEDHIGGLPEVIKNFDIGKIYMPKKSANTKIFESLLNEIEKKGLKITEAKAGLSIVKDSDLEFSIFAPNSEDYPNINEYSIVNKLKYKDMSIIFTGDAEKISEDEMIKKGYNLSSDVLKVGHHGSSTSSTVEFLEQVNPRYAVISSEAGNDYGHPHKEVIDRLNQKNINILRTDEMGTIKLESDGQKIVFSNEKGNTLEKYNSENKSNVSKNIQKNKTYIGNKNTKVYHTSDCDRLPNLENRMNFKSIKEAEDAGYRKDNSCVK